MNATTWVVPVNAHPTAVRWRSIGETRPVEPTEAACLLPVPNWPDQPCVDGLPVRLHYPNQFFVRLGDAHHYTALGFPA